MQDDDLIKESWNSNLLNVLRCRFDQKRTCLHLNEEIELLDRSNLEAGEIRRQADPHLVA